MDQQPEWLSLDETANLLKVGVATVQSLIDRGILSSQRRGEQIEVSYDAILTFLQEDQRKLFQEGGQPPDLGLVSGGEEAA